jgi:hypothetical protein
LSRAITLNIVTEPESTSGTSEQAVEKLRRLRDLG